MKRLGKNQKWLVDCATKNGGFIVGRLPKSGPFKTSKAATKCADSLVNKGILKLSHSWIYEPSPK